MGLVYWDFSNAFDKDLHAESSGGFHDIQGERSS